MLSNHGGRNTIIYFNLENPFYQSLPLSLSYGHFRVNLTMTYKVVLDISKNILDFHKNTLDIHKNILDFHKNMYFQYPNFCLSARLWHCYTIWQVGLLQLKCEVSQSWSGLFVLVQIYEFSALQTARPRRRHVCWENKGRSYEGDVWNFKSLEIFILSWRSVIVEHPITELHMQGKHRMKFVMVSICITKTVLKYPKFEQTW